MSGLVESRVIDISLTTYEKYRLILKSFYKWVYLNIGHHKDRKLPNVCSILPTLLTFTFSKLTPALNDLYFDKIY